MSITLTRMSKASESLTLAFPIQQSAQVTSLMCKSQASFFKVSKIEENWRADRFLLTPEEMDLKVLCNIVAIPLAIL